MVFRKAKDLLEEYLSMQRIAALQGPADILQDDMSADLTQCQWPSLSLSRVTWRIIGPLLSWGSLGWHYGGRDTVTEATRGHFISYETCVLVNIFQVPSTLSPLDRPESLSRWIGVRLWERSGPVLDWADKEKMMHGMVRIGTRGNRG